MVVCLVEVALWSLTRCLGARPPACPVSSASIDAIELFCFGSRPSTQHHILCHIGSLEAILVMLNSPRHCAYCKARCVEFWELRCIGLVTSRSVLGLPSHTTAATDCVQLHKTQDEHKPFIKCNRTKRKSNRYRQIDTVPIIIITRQGYGRRFTTVYYYLIVELFSLVLL